MLSGFDSDELMCRVDSLSYDFNDLTGTLFLPEGNCVDMKGCIALFKRIDPRVTSISTYAGEAPDTEYEFNGEEWKAYGPAIH